MGIMPDSRRIAQFLRPNLSGTVADQPQTEIHQRSLRSGSSDLGGGIAAIAPTLLVLKEKFDGKWKFWLDRGHMKTRTIVVTLALCFVAAAVCFASNAQNGTWKLNEAKSKLAPGVAKNHTVVIEAAGDNVKVTVDGTDPAGKPTHHEWTGKFDGKDYPVTGDPTADTRSLKKIDDRTSELTVKKDGKVTVRGRIVVSADGKSRTVTTSGTSPKGKKFKSTAVYDKQ
jgi:hypothetical protein